MGVVDILFNPTGRIRASEFWRGVIILIGLGVITQVAALYGPPALAIASLLVQLVMIYMYVCVFGKRLHDSGKTAWLSILFFIGIFVLSFIGKSVFFPFVEGYSELEAEMTAEITANGLNLEVMGAYGERLAELTAWPNLILNVVAGLIGSFFCARLWSDPYPNKYGDPVGGYVEPEDEDDFLT